MLSGPAIGRMQCGTLGSVAQVLRDQGVGPFDPRTCAFPAPPDIECDRVVLPDADDEAEIVIDLPVAWNFMFPFSNSLFFDAPADAAASGRLRICPYVYYTMRLPFRLYGLTCTELSTYPFRLNIDSSAYVRTVAVSVVLITPYGLTPDYPETFIEDVYINGSPTTGRLVICSFDPTSYVLTLAEPTVLDSLDVIVFPEFADVRVRCLVFSVINDDV